VLAYRDELTNQMFPEFDTSGLAFIKSWLRLVDYNVSTPGIVELFCVVSAEATSEDHPAHDFFKQRYVDTIELVHVAMADLLDQGHIYSDSIPLDLARALVALSDGLQVQWLLDRKWDMLEEHKSFFRRILTDQGLALAKL
jgi:hypothetical protein